MRCPRNTDLQRTVTFPFFEDNSRIKTKTKVACVFHGLSMMLQLTWAASKKRDFIFPHKYGLPRFRQVVVAAGSQAESPGSKSPFRTYLDGDLFECLCQSGPVTASHIAQDVIKRKKSNCVDAFNIILRETRNVIDNCKCVAPALIRHSGQRPQSRLDHQAVILKRGCPVSTAYYTLCPCTSPKKEVQLESSQT